MLYFQTADELAYFQVAVPSSLSSWGFNGWAIYMRVNSCKCALTNGVSTSDLIEVFLVVICSPKLLPSDGGKGSL